MHVLFNIMIQSTVSGWLWLRGHKFHQLLVCFPLVLFTCHIINSPCQFRSCHVLLPCNQVIPLTWVSLPISSPAGHSLISSSVFILVHFHLFPARLSWVFSPSSPAFLILFFFCLVCLLCTGLPVFWTLDTQPALLQISEYRWLSSPGLHVKVSLHDSHHHQCMNVITVSYFGHKCLINALNVNVVFIFDLNICPFYINIDLIGRI